MKVIMCAYGVGYKSTLPPKNVIKLNLNTYRTEYRERTQEELQIEKEKWDSTPHLLSGEGYVNRIRHEKVAFLNPAFPNNIIEKINELQKEGLFDTILVESDSILANALKQREDIEFVYFYPEKKEKAITQMLSNDELPLSAIRFYSNHWNWFQTFAQTYPNSTPIFGNLEEELEKEELENEFERD